MNDGTIRRRAGDVPAAIRCLDAALAEAREAGFLALERAALLALASAHNVLGQYGEAAELAAQGIDLAKEPEDPLLEARFSNALAAFQYSLGDLGNSIEHSERAIHLASGIDAASWSAFFRYGLAHTLLELGAHEAALEVIEEARRTVEELHITGHHVVLETHRAHAELCRSDPAGAAARIEGALESGAPPSLDPDYTYAVLALAQLRRGDAEQAIATLDLHAVRPLHRSRALAVRIEAARRLGRDAEGEIQEAQALLEDPRLTPVESLELRRSVVDALERTGRAPAAARHRSAAGALVARLGRTLAARPEVASRFAAQNADFDRAST
jgi:tetratricopeptide (TPR) repeat protein